MTTVLKSDVAIEASRIVTYSRRTSTGNPSSDQQATDDDNGQARDVPSTTDSVAGQISMVFSASVNRPTSPYAEPVLRVDFVQQTDEEKGNNSVIQPVSI